jgi:hypothetical protein
MNAAKLLIALILLFPAIVGRAEEGVTSSNTAPQFLLDAQIVETGQGQVLVAARPYYETVEQSYHLESSLRQLGEFADGKTARQRSDAVLRIETQTQQIAVLQSTIVKFGVRQLWLSKLDGTEATLHDLRGAIANDKALLLLPDNANLHPGIRAILHPNTLVISKISPDRGKVVARPLSRLPADDTKRATTV